MAELSDSLVEGARYFVRDLGKVTEDEDVLILTDARVDEPVLNAYVAAVSSIGGNSTVMTVPYEWPAGEIPDPFSEPQKRAIFGADVVLHLLSVMAHPSIKTFCTANCEYGTRIVYCPWKAETIMSEYPNYPHEIIHAVSEWQSERLSEAEELRITCEKGTDFRCDIKDHFYWSAPERGQQLGQIGSSITPPSYAAVNRDDGAIPGAEGEIYADELEGIPGGLEEPTKWIVEDHGDYSWVTDVEGGWEAQKWWDRWKDVENANLFSEVMWATHPKAGVRTNPLFESGTHDSIIDPTRHSGVIHFAMGSPPSRCEGNLEIASNVHVHLHLYRPTIKAGNETLVDRGHTVAFDDPEIREVAAKYGDPDELLREVP
jgi:hypothetical protein